MSNLILPVLTCMTAAAVKPGPLMVGKCWSRQQRFPVSHMISAVGLWNFLNINVRLVRLSKFQLLPILSTARPPSSISASCYCADFSCTLWQPVAVHIHLYVLIPLAPVLAFNALPLMSFLIRVPYWITSNLYPSDSTSLASTSSGTFYTKEPAKGKCKLACRGEAKRAKACWCWLHRASCTFTASTFDALKTNGLGIIDREELEYWISKSQWNLKYNMIR